MRAGRLLRDQGRYADAEREYLSGVRAAEQFGARDPRLARMWSNLAALYFDQGRYAEGADWLRRALEHPDVAANLMNLGAVERAPGDRHPSVEVTRRNLAEVNRALGQRVEAAPRIKQPAAGLSGAGTLLVPRADTGSR
ncbi:MAG: tetratricopeptide repeat protein [Bryobacteraceae bacterium]